MERLFDYKRATERWNREWERAGIFTPQRPSSREAFVIILPPPNVTGILTVGHILGNTVQDTYIRWKKMEGYNILWLPGFDHAGIATQKVVEDELLKSRPKRADMSREDFLKHCWKWKEERQERITEQLKGLGCALDWTRACFTLDEKRSKAVRRVFVHLYKKGLVYRGDYTVNWCPKCQTAISDEEVEFKEKNSYLYWIKYPLVGGSTITVATTRPETMLGDTAVGVSTKDKNKRKIAGKTAILPIIDRKLPIIADDSVDPEFGSGFVKVTPAHDPNDFLFAKRHNLPFVVVIDKTGRMTDRAGEKFSSMDRFEARKKILEELKGEGLLEKVEPYRHSVGHHDRCKTVIEPLLSREWFVKMKPLAEPAIECVEKGEIEFYPPRWRNVYLSWMGEIRDWCVSRHLWWGHRIPVWYCPEGHLTVSINDPSSCETCSATELKQDENVLDTWFSSWLWTFSPLGWPEDTEDLKNFHPTTLLVTGFDIIFFWVARMIMASLEFMQEIPFKQVFLTGIVRDAKGRKMSKSLGNSPDPLGVMEKYGADAFRFTMVMLSPPGHDVYFAEEKVEVGRNFVNKIWQASRMIIAAYEKHESPLFGDGQGAISAFAKRWDEDFGITLSFEPELNWEDKWILDTLEMCMEDVNVKLSSWRINEAAGKLYDFFWHELCDWYLELAKIRLYGEGDEAAVLSVLLYVLAQSMKLLHPFMPYVTEEIWDILPMTRGVILEHRYSHAAGSFRFEAIRREMEIFQSMVTSARNIRAQYHINPSVSIKLMIKTPGKNSIDVDKMKSGFKKLVKADAIEYGPDIRKEKGMASTPVGAYEVIVPLGGIADVETEIQRLSKEKIRLESAYTSVKKKLSNKEFLEKAKEEVILREKERRALIETELSKINESLRLLQDL